jgi:hypothetical protein
MANPFRQQSRFRKLTYFGIILVLFTVSLVHRRFLIEPEAMRLQLREQAKGEVELTSSAVRLTLVGSRGLATCALWWTAQQKQKKQQWNELELVVRSITKLQPHFISPWRFQGWNLAFNVSVQCDRARDKYFYISRGLELLAEGERRNQGTQDEGDAAAELHFPGNPNMRFDLGFFYQLKIAQSDDKHYMRCLLDLSCMDPAKRDPAAFWSVAARSSREGTVRRVINQARLEEFCRSYPRLVRRLREHLGRSRPADVVAFLEDNQDVPCRFEKPSAATAGKETPLKKPREQFPILPSPHKLPPSLPDPNSRELPFAVDVFQIARAWYIYAQEPLPPADPDEAIKEVTFDSTRYRLPSMATIIFRSHPARALFYVADGLEEEGWFDGQDGWTIADWFDAGGDRRRKRPVRVGTESRYHAAPAWQRAYDAYRDLGEKNGLYYTPQQLLELTRRAELYLKTYLAPSEDKRKVRPGQLKGGMARSYEAAKRLEWQAKEGHFIDYSAYLNQAAVEKEANTVAVRKLFFLARRRTDEAARAEAVALYEQAFPRWIDLLLQNPMFRRIPEIQENTYERELRYQSLLRKVYPARRPPVLLAVLQFGLARPGVPVLASLPVLPLDVNQTIALFPLDRFAWPLEKTLVLETHEAMQGPLQDFLLGLTQGAMRPPLPLTQFQKDRILLARTLNEPTFEGPPAGPVQWTPLVGREAIRAIRQLYRLNRHVPPAAPPPGTPMPPTRPPRG